MEENKFIDPISEAFRVKQKEFRENRVKELKRFVKNGREYWEWRCRYLEIYIDPTYMVADKDNAYLFYQTLVKM